VTDVIRTYRPATLIAIADALDKQSAASRAAAPLPRSGRAQLRKN